MSNLRRVNKSWSMADLIVRLMNGVSSHAFDAFQPRQKCKCSLPDILYEDSGLDMLHICDN